MSPTVTVPQLTGRLVHLAALSEDHVEGLLHAADDHSTFGYTSVPRSRDDLMAQVKGLFEASAAGEAIPFAQLRASDAQASGNV